MYNESHTMTSEHNNSDQQQQQQQHNNSTGGITGNVGESAETGMELINVISKELDWVVNFDAIFQQLSNESGGSNINDFGLNALHNAVGGMNLMTLADEEISMSGSQIHNTNINNNNNNHSNKQQQHTQQQQQQQYYGNNKMNEGNNDNDNMLENEMLIENNMNIGGMQAMQPQTSIGDMKRRASLVIPNIDPEIAGPAFSSENINMQAQTQTQTQGQTQQQQQSQNTNHSNNNNNSNNNAVNDFWPSLSSVDPDRLESDV